MHHTPCSIHLTSLDLTGSTTLCKILLQTYFLQNFCYLNRVDASSRNPCLWSSRNPFHTTVETCAPNQGVSGQSLEHCGGHLLVDQDLNCKFYVELFAVVEIKTQYLNQFDIFPESIASRCDVTVVTNSHFHSGDQSVTC